MRLRKTTPSLAFFLACCTAAIATFGFLLQQGSRIPSMRRSIGEDLTIIGAPGFVLGATLTGGHQTTLASTAISGTIVNAIIYFLLWFVILKFIQSVDFRRKAN
jgi:hypothetical protein